MSLHYLLNTDTLEQRTVRTETRDRYLEPWKEYPSETECINAAIAEKRWGVEPASGDGPIEILPMRRDAYQRAGWKLYNTKAEADANAPVRFWMVTHGIISELRGTNQLERCRQIGTEVFYTFEKADKALGPVIYAVRRNSRGPVISIREAQRDTYYEQGYVFGATNEEAIANVPPAYVMDAHGQYVRCNPNTLARPFSYLRSLVRSLKTYDDYELNALWHERIHAPSYAATETMPRVQHFFAELTDRMQRRGRTLHEIAETLNHMLRTYMDYDFQVCDDCNSKIVMENFNGSVIRPDHIVCHECAQNYSHCCECECMFHRDDMNEGENGEYYCDDHMPDYSDDDDGAILQHTANVLLRRSGFLLAQGEKQTPLWLGWELECYPKGDRDKHSVAEYVYDQCHRWAIIKRDGSIEDGIEIVSVPASLQWHREHVKPFLIACKDHIEGWQHNDAGIHVHVGKSELNPMQQGKLLAFIHARENQSFITAIAGRMPNNYCQRGESHKRITDYKREAGRGRYQSLNFSTRGEKTVEFRLFRSNTSAAGFLKNLELVHALCMWTRHAGMMEIASYQANINMRGPRAGYQNLIAWVSENRATYPLLMRWLIENAYARGAGAESPSAAA